MRIKCHRWLSRTNSNKSNTMQTIIAEFDKFMGKHGQYYHEFYVGVATDPNDRLVNGHGVTIHIWLFYLYHAHMISLLLICQMSLLFLVFDFLDQERPCYVEWTYSLVRLLIRLSINLTGKYVRNLGYLSLRACDYLTLF